MEWWAFEQIEPSPEHRSDLNFARVLCMIANMWGRKEGAEAYPVTDFMLTFGPPEDPEQKADKQLWTMQLMAAHANAVAEAKARRG